MKKLCIIVVLVFSSLFVPVKAADYPVLPYGAMVTNPITLEGNYITPYGSVFYNDAGFKYEATEEEAHSGKRSFKIYCDSADKGKGCSLELAILNKNGLNENSLYLEAYVKYDGGFNKNIWPVALFDNKLRDGFTLNKEEPDENGWRRIWGIVPPCEYNKIRFGIQYTRNTEDVGKSVYIDDITVRYIPVSVSIDDSRWDKSSLPLDRNLVYGEDKNGKRTLISAKEYINYDVLSENAYIDKNKNLVYMSSKPRDEVRLRAEFLGISTEFSIYMSADKMVFGEISEDGESYSAIVINNTPNEKRAALIVCIFDGDSLSNIYTKTESLKSGDTKEVIAPIPEIPFYVKDPIVKAYIVAYD